MPCKANPALHAPHACLQCVLDAILTASPAPWPSEEQGPSLLLQACARAWRCSATSHVRVRAWAWMSTMTTTSSCRWVAAGGATWVASIQ